jgi:hypothetical protein
LLASRLNAFSRWHSVEERRQGGSCVKRKKFQQLCIMFLAIEAAMKPLKYACRRSGGVCPAKTVSQLRYMPSDVPITGLTEK